jgi:formate/nitrite transporter FocA (FNT family)
MDSLKTPQDGSPASPDLPDLNEQERRRVEERIRPSAVIVHETIRIDAAEELRRHPKSLAWSGLAGGLSMGFSMLAESHLQAALPEALWRPLITKLGYSVGFLIVVLGRQQLYTENTLSPILPLLRERDAKTLTLVLRLWTIVLAANLLGALIFSAVVGMSQVFSPEAHRAIHEIGRKLMEDEFGPMFLKAIFAGWLIALMVWLLPGAEGGRVGVIIILTYLVGLAGLPHIIAGSVEALYLVVVGSCSWWSYLADFFVPTLLGNTLGGVVLVALINHAQADLG